MSVPADNRPPAEWLTRAVCRDLPDTEVRKFWATRDTYERQTAYGYCFGCPVRWDCLKTAHIERDQFAVVGGTPPDFRDTARKAGWSFYKLWILSFRFDPRYRRAGRLRRWRFGEDD